MESVETSVPEPASAGRKGPSYFMVFVGLAVLTAVEVAIAFITAIPKTALIAILVGLALWKALLVALYYMHLRFEPAKLWWMVLAPLPLGIILVGIVLVEGW